MMLTALITRNYHRYQMLILILEGQEPHFVPLAIASQAEVPMTPPDQSSDLLSHVHLFSYILICSDIY